MRRRHETEFYARQASILLGNNACRSGNDRSPTLKVFFALSRGRRGTQRALNSVSCLLLEKAAIAVKADAYTLSASTYLRELALRSTRPPTRPSEKINHRGKRTDLQRVRTVR